MLAVSPTGAYRGCNTSLHRIRALESLGAEVEVIDTADDGVRGIRRLRYRVQNRLYVRGLSVPLPDLTLSAERALDAARRRSWDIIWLEKALTIGPDSVRALRRACPRASIIGFSPDEMTRRHNQSRQFVRALPHYDWFITTKADSVPQLKQLGCRNVVVVGNGFDPQAFRPVDVSASDVERLGGGVGFIGTYERERADHMLALARAGVRVRVWGDGWHALREKHPHLRVEHRALDFDDFARACRAFEINLGFLRKLNADQQTTRSVEIPACGGFMLAERTAEHLALFEEGSEAEFFASDAELIEKCRRYLGDGAARAEIARRGQQRCATSGYSNAARLRQAFGVIWGAAGKPAR
ncbi:MAG TPA: glycosyltransferase [Polyangiaceae bacterium]|nr:glycosyltransferase [Polyangiaceae bacterium]